MKRLFKLMAFAIATATMLIGCVEPNDPPVDPVEKPTLEINGVEEDIDQAVVSLTVKGADKICYTTYTKGARPTEIVWSEQAVTADGKLDITVEITPGKDDKAGETEYTFEAYASLTKDKKDYVSENKTTDFKLVYVAPDMPALSITAIEVEAAGIKATVSVKNADKVCYTYYVKDAKPTDIAWTEKAVEADGKLDIVIENITAESTTAYTFEAYACLESTESAHATKDFTLTVVDQPTLAIDKIEVDGLNATATMTVANAGTVKYAFYVKGARPTEIAWSDKDVTADGAIDVTVTTQTAETTTYTFEAYAIFESTDSEHATKDFTITVAPADTKVTFSNINGSPYQITADVKWENTGYICRVIEKSDDAAVNTKNYDEFVASVSTDAFQKAINDGEGGLIAKCDTQFEHVDKVIAGKSYFIYAVAVKGSMLKDQYGFPYVLATGTTGAIATYEISIPAFNFGQCDAAATIGNVKAEYTRLIPTLTRNETAYTVYCGAVAKADLGAQNIETYVLNWLSADNKVYGANYKAIGGVSFYGAAMPGETATLHEQIEAPVGELKMGTEYVYWVFALNDKREVGKLSSVEVTTDSMPVETTASVKLTPTLDQNGQKVTFAVEYLDGCVSFDYLIETLARKNPQPYTESYVLRTITDSPTNAVPVTGSSFFINLISDRDHIIHILPKDKEGKLGAIQHISFTTKMAPIEFTGDATVESIKVAGPSPFVENERNKASWAIDITKGSNCDGFVYYCERDDFYEGVSTEDQAREAIKLSRINSTTDLGIAAHVAEDKCLLLFVIPYKNVANGREYGKPEYKFLPYAVEE